MLRLQMSAYLLTLAAVRSGKAERSWDENDSKTKNKARRKGMREGRKDDIRDETDMNVRQE